MRFAHLDCSIRKSADQCVLTTPRSLSQLITSFFGSQCQGIRPALFLALPFASCFPEFSWISICFANIVCCAFWYISSLSALSSFEIRMYSFSRLPWHWINLFKNLRTHIIKPNWLLIQILVVFYPIKIIIFIALLVVSSFALLLLYSVFKFLFCS